MSNGAGAVVIGVFAVGVAVLAFGSTYTINEGNIGVKTWMGQATGQEGPSGLRFKMPVFTGIEEFDVRERTIQSTTTAGTDNQLSANIAFSVNWRPMPDRILEIYRNYGGPNEFAANVIISRMNQAVKSAIGDFTGQQLYRERQAVADKMLANIRTALDGYPAIFESVQLDDFALPEWYNTAVRTKEEQREKTEQSLLALEQQRNEAQQLVQSAEAKRDSDIAAADATAYATRAQAAAEAEAQRAEADASAYATTVRAEAEASSIAQIGAAEAESQRLLGAAITENPALVQWRQAEAWDGSVPQMMMGEGAGVSPVIPMNMVRQ